ncbi:MAG: hypothetical protein DI586_09195 [Micavibrio aeruginosavorus]|uniref:Uncharacterized protein n=1 Tax=Micavibrio aeruginosavorus TaxID=349221 RepID=A0A2W5FLK6_9BACT|nr:MAG: hypothetical protein DI586_09195 [Micavibrio aeruginosavorus]
MKFFVFLLLSMAISSSVMAQTRLSVGAACYTPLEAEAEQGIRIHSELMVIALNCQHLTPVGQENLYSQFRKFTAKNAALFSTYEMLLINFFKKTGSSNPDREMHTLRTNYANRISKDAATMRPDAFCSTYMPRIQKAAVMNEASLHKWASTFFPGFGPTRPICANR